MVTLQPRMLYFCDTEAERSLSWGEGALIFTKDTSKWWTIVGGAYELKTCENPGIPSFARVTGSNATTTGQSLTNITGLSIPLLANSVYEFEAFLSCQTSAVTTGTGYGVQFSAAGASIEAQIDGALTSTASKNLRINALNTAASPYLTTSGQTGCIVIKGIIVTGANAGNLTIQHLKVTSGTSTVFINSFLKAIKIG